VKNTIICALAAAALLAGPDHAAAQDRSSTRGLMLGVRANFSAIQSDEDGGSVAERGGGLGALLGFGVTEQISLFLRADAASIAYEGDEDESYALANVDLAGRYSVGTASEALRPYFELGLSGTAIQDDVELDGQTFDVVYSGPALLLGFGAEYFLSPQAALDVGMALGKGRFTNLQVDGEEADDVEEIDFTTVRMSVGFTFHP
jgi:outer membrane protein W